MENANETFYGQHTDEKILYVITPAPIVQKISLFKTFVLAGFALVVFMVLASFLPFMPELIRLFGLGLALIIVLVGYFSTKRAEKINRAYITDRRIIRFTASSLFGSNSRSLSWGDVLKVKTFAPNFIYRSLKVGTVIIHSSSSVNEENSDDIELHDVYYYQDLGNYIEKILFTYKRRPEELDSIRPFVPKPKGKRY